ncbi:MarR family winged helix-turn-helix transcriptional regulator [Pseudoflavonifractor phocaeensis]|uniref:MarR family winged helix-turn-helix transcriptional regulator n=1 Tax=Pseudoflavonifractor phocaeensis TaxID=1870988 RepID=UPI00195AC942|nr:MarR family transcriptional regulator [Pseudoflavonifractor phocaeensis]MBM6724793.1 MarR family transcriptional regulator [Pseudoflavonifractor phocaeensis]
MESRMELFRNVIAAFDEGFDLAEKYDSMVHRYGEETLYQSEMHLLQAVGRTPGITMTEIALSASKTKSACSQMVHKLQKRGLLTQVRNSQNNREYKLYLTDRGREIYCTHEKFDEACLNRSYVYLSGFQEQELQTYIAVQKRLNEAFKADIEQNS